MINRLLRLMSLEPRGTYYPGCTVFIIYGRYIKAQKYQILSTFCPLEETLCFSAREAWHGRKLYTLKQFGGPDGLRWLLAEGERSPLALFTNSISISIIRWRLPQSDGILVGSSIFFLVWTALSIFQWVELNKEENFIIDSQRHVVKNCLNMDIWTIKFIRSD